MARVLSLVASLAVLAGCSNGTAELSKKDEGELRNNFSRALTPAEIARMRPATDAGSTKK